METNTVRFFRKTTKLISNELYASSEQCPSQSDQENNLHPRLDEPCIADQ